MKMTVAKLKQFLQNYSDDLEVIVACGITTDKVYQLDPYGNRVMYLVPETRDIYLREEKAEESGKIYSETLVLFSVPYRS